MNVGRRAALETLTRRGRAFLVLARMARHEGPVSMTAFARASLLAAERARLLREDLEALGLVVVEAREARGPVEVLSIRLTPLGREVAAHVLAIEDLLETRAAQL